MKVFESTLVEALEADVTLQSLQLSVAKAESEQEMKECPWQVNDDGTTSLLGIINGVLEATTGMVLMATFDDDDGKFLWWSLRQVWW